MLSLTHTVVFLFTHNVLTLLTHPVVTLLTHTVVTLIMRTTVTLLVHTVVTLLTHTVITCCVCSHVMSVADRGIHVQEADKQKPSVLELLAHFRSCVVDKARLFPAEGQKQLLERVIKEYNSLMKVCFHDGNYLSYYHTSKMQEKVWR